MCSYVLCLFQFWVDIRDTCSHACMVLLAIPCLDLCVLCVYFHNMVRSLSSHAYMLGFMFFHVYVLSFYMFTCTFLCLYV